jgi:N-acetylglucosaminyldiphosphoundecaprenol N-acetyl-beta-D-mannosaminyltransferase
LKSAETLKKKFFNLHLDVLTTEQVLNLTRNFLNSSSTHTIFFLNAHCFNLAQKNPSYYQSLNKTDLLLNDGIGIKLASLFTNVKIKENLNGTDLIPIILSIAAANGNNVFFLGGQEGVAELAARNAMNKISGLNVTGYHSGFFNKTDEPELIQKINNSNAEILVLGMGVPKQEIWAFQNQDLLKATKIIIAGGAILDFLSENIKRAPRWVRKINMEWLFRLYLEPKRMWKRYVIGNIVFFYHVISLKLIHKEI